MLYEPVHYSQVTAASAPEGKNSRGERIGDGSMGSNREERGERRKNSWSGSQNALSSGPPPTGGTPLHCLVVALGSPRWTAWHLKALLHSYMQWLTPLRFEAKEQISLKEQAQAVSVFLNTPLRPCIPMLLPVFIWHPRSLSHMSGP